jgi:uncharacterized FlaG/YvyC family protein
MSIDTIPFVPQGAGPIGGSGSIESALATPEPFSENRNRPVLKSPDVAQKVIGIEVDLDSEVTKAINTIDLMMDVRERSVQFERDQASGKDVIKIVDDETGEVIRQMPPEELLGFMRNLTKMLGNFLDERV